MVAVMKCSDDTSMRIVEAIVFLFVPLVQRRLVYESEPHRETP